MPRPGGQAALMLSESLGLLPVETGIVSRQAALDAIDGLVEVKEEIAGVQKGVAMGMASIALLRRVRESLAAAREPGRSKVH